MEGDPVDDQNERKHFFDNPKNVRLVIRSLFAVCAFLFLLDVVDAALEFFEVGDLRHTERPWEGWPGFYGVYGFVACVLLVLIAKELRKVLMRGEDFYDR